MPTAYKDAMVQGTASIGTYATLYSTSASTTAIISNIIIANESASAVTVNLGVVNSASAPASGQFLLEEVVVSGAETLSFGPYALGNTRFIRVASSASTCTFAAAIAEIT